MILTFHAEEYFLFLALRAGATGYVLKTRIMQKLGIHNRIGLVRYALLHDLLKEDLEEVLS